VKRELKTVKYNYKPMRPIVHIIAFAFWAFSPIIGMCQSNEKNVGQNYSDLVNPLMGTDSEFSFSNGNTYPAIATPWGMNFWTPQTAKMGDGWCYAYDAYKIRGIKQTHQPSPWINDYGAFSLMAVTGDLKITEEERASWFSHKAETVKPYYYNVYLADYDTRVELTPTDRAAIYRFTFPENDRSYILLDGFFKGSKVTINTEEQTITGYCRNNSGGTPENFHNFFVAKFDKPFKVYHTWCDDKLTEGSTNAEGKHAIAVIGFETKKNEQVNVKVASSFISLEQAKLNLQREIGAKTFEEVKAESQQIWDRELGKIKVEGGTSDELKTFYSSLYRVLLFPRKFWETNEADQIIHYSPYNGKIEKGYLYTDNGFWDTFRAVFPLFTLVYPEHSSKVMQGLVNTYNESGWLPEWASPGHRACMIGSNSASLITDAYLKGIGGFDMNTLYEAILKNTKNVHPDIKSVGRWGYDHYNQLGYIPYDVDINENTARTLEYAYADFCIWQLAKKMNRPTEEVELFKKRSQNYRNVFDKESNLMRGRNKDGSFQSPFSPYKWGDAFTEGNSWHYTWSVFHDINGLVKLMGGNNVMAQMLDSVFIVPPVFDCSYYGFPIHEIREMQVAGMGNYAHGNQPIQHMIYLYNYVGQPWKAQQHVRDVLKKLYTPQPDGYCGDEDNGQTSAWYVFSSMGFYPVCPGTNQYVFGSPLFNKITIAIDGGKPFVIKGPNNSAENIYVEKASLNGKPWDKMYINHETIRQGGELEFIMQPVPNKERGTSPDTFPYSESE